MNRDSQEYIRGYGEGVLHTLHIITRSFESLSPSMTTQPTKTTKTGVKATRRGRPARKRRGRPPMNRVVL